MDYFYIVVDVVAGIYAYTYARWLRREGNALGAFGVILLLVLSIAVPIYRIVTA